MPFPFFISDPGEKLGGHTHVRSQYILGKPICDMWVFFDEIVVSLFGSLGKIADDPSLAKRGRPFGHYPKERFNGMAAGF